jgi:uncharacterized membrane protein
MVTWVVILGFFGSAMLAIALTKSRDGDGDETWDAGAESAESRRRSCGGGGCGGCGGGCSGCGGCGGCGG